MTDQQFAAPREEQEKARHLASAMKKLLPKPLLDEVLGYLDPLGTFLKVLDEAALSTPSPVSLPPRDSNYYAQAVDLVCDELAKLSPEKLDERRDKMIAILRHAALAFNENEPRSAAPASEPPKVQGYDAKFWNESYLMLRDAVTTHLDGFIHDDDVAEECILVDAIERAGKAAAAPVSEELEKLIAKIAAQREDVAAGADLCLSLAEVDALLSALQQEGK